MPYTPEQLDTCQQIEDALTHFKDGFKTFEEMLTTIAGTVQAVLAKPLKFDPHSYDTEVLDGEGNWYYDRTWPTLPGARERFKEIDDNGLKCRIMRRRGQLVLGVVDVSSI